MSEIATSLHAANYLMNGCNVCGDSLEQIEQGQNCPGCGSRSRHRSLKTLLERYIAPILDRGGSSREKKLLAFAMSGVEVPLISAYFPSYYGVSLYPQFGAFDESGVDARDLSRYEDNSFQGYYGCAIFDYFEEHMMALREAYRVVEPGGIFFTHIVPYRLFDNLEPPKDFPTYNPDGTRKFPYKEDGFIQHVKVGKQWFVEAMREVGFESAIVDIKDNSANVNNVWFVGLKSKKKL